MTTATTCAACGKPLPQDPEAREPYPWARCLACQLKKTPLPSDNGEGDPSELGPPPRQADEAGVKMADPPPQDEPVEPRREPTGEGSFALPIEEFIAAKTDAPEPLIGTADDCVLPAYGLLLLIAKGGKGKTTLTIDAILHFASGLPWLGFEVPRPLRVLLIENEGPREPFRRKLERRLEHWPHPLTGGIDIYGEDWGQARLNEPGFVERLNRYVAEHEIDLVVGDPLDTLGMDGVGSPEDTRNMVARFQAAGLFSRVAWWLPHHARKEKVEDAIDEASGAWGGKPDALLGLEKLPGDRPRLSFHKLRWGRRDGFAYLLGYDGETEGFELVAEESGEERDYAAEIEALLVGGADERWMTVREISAPTIKGGIGAGREQVEEALKAGEPERFVSRTGEQAKAVERSPRATIWGLASAQRPVEPVGSSEGDSGVGLDSGSALKGQSQSEPVPRPEPELASTPEPVEADEAGPDASTPARGPSRSPNPKRPNRDGES